jgi:predicted dinucleotide-utilizing enzyme
VLAGVKEAVPLASATCFISVRSRHCFLKFVGECLLRRNAVLQRLVGVAEHCRSQILIPSGALAGLDALAAAGGKFGSPCCSACDPPCPSAPG